MYSCCYDYSVTVITVILDDYIFLLHTLKTVIFLILRLFKGDKNMRESGHDLLNIREKGKLELKNRRGTL